MGTELLFPHFMRITHHQHDHELLTCSYSGCSKTLFPLLFVSRELMREMHIVMWTCTHARVYIVTDFVVSDQWRCVMPTQLIINHRLLLSKINLLSLLAYNGYNTK